MKLLILIQTILVSHLIENAENDLYNLSNLGSAERKYSKFGEALKRCC